MIPILLLVACAARPVLRPERAPEPARVGLRFQALPEGLVVTEVVPGMGAARAGLGVGDLIVEIDGQSAVGLSADAARARLQGAPGTAVRVRATAPITGEDRALELRRGLEPDPRAGAGRSPLKLAFQEALSQGEPDEAVAATEALADADYGGEPAADAIGRSLLVAMRDRPAVGRAVAEALSRRAGQDARLHAALGEAWLRAGDPARAVEHLRAAESLRPPDVSGPDARGDVGGAVSLRTQLAQALWRDGQREAAGEVARALARTVDAPQLYGELGLAPPDRGAVWRGTLAPLAALETTLLDGAPWSLEARRGQVTLLAFWASWCAPCREELPHLQELWARHRAQGFEVLAVSVDRQDARDEAVQAARRLDLTMPLAHEPAWSDRFDVGSIPALRLVGRDGAIRYSSHGYSPAGVEALERELTAALAETAGSGTPLGNAWTSGAASLLAFLPLPGVGDVWSDGARLVLGVDNGAPLVVEAGEVAAGWTGLPTPDASEAARAVAGRVAWLGGPVATEPGRPWVRAWDEDGAHRWLRTLPSPVRDLAVVGDQLWVATEAELLRLGSDGALLGRLAVPEAALAAEAGGAWVLSGGQLSWLGSDGGALEPRRPSPDGAVVAPGGWVATPVATGLVRGRFGPDGALRAVVARPDGAVVAIGADGAPAFALTPTGSDAAARLAAWDPDGDGRDQLVLALAGRGVAVVDLVLP